MMNAKLGNLDKPEKFQSWRLYNQDFNKPKHIRNKVPSLSPKQKENINLSPSRLGKIGNNIIGQSIFSPKKNYNFNLPSSSGYIYPKDNYNNFSIDHSFRSYNMNSLKGFIPEESKEQNIYISEQHDNTFSYKDTNNINENIEISNVHNYSYQDNIERYSELTLDLSLVSQHFKFFEIWVDLEVSLDNKQLLNAICNRFLNDFNSEFLKNGLIIEVFSPANLNRTYNKIIKIQLILIYVLKFVIGEFCSYDIITTHNQIKRIIISFSETMALFIDLFFLNNLNPSFLADYKILSERIAKLLKMSYKRYKRNEDIFNINKLLETSLNSIKNLMSTIFNYALFNALHSASFEIIRNLDKLSTKKLGDLIINNLLYGIVKKEQIKRGNKVLNAGYMFEKNNVNLKIKAPFLPPPEDGNKFTLVLDLDETLIHFFYTPSGGTFFIRPGAMDLLESLCDLFEIVIFTAGMKDYADNILDFIDPHYNLIKHRLYRHHTTLYGMAFVKDLSKIGRDLAKTIIIDNISENFILQPNNGLPIKTWTQDIQDTQLIDLNKILKDIYDTKVSDVRPIVKRINEEVVKSYRLNVNNPYFKLEINKLIEN